MRSHRVNVTLSCAGLAVVFSAGAAAQDYPTKPIRIVCSEPGGGTDIVARLIAQELTPGFNQRVVVDNRGGSNVIPAELVAKSPPDGYTLLLLSNTLWLLPLLEKVSFDPVRDFSPITLAVRSPNILVVHPSLPVKSVKELIALARHRPGELNYASGITGASTHLAAELFKSMAAVNIVRVPYRGTAPALVDLIGGQVQLMFSTAASVVPHIKSARLRALAVTTLQPSRFFPDLPTVAASGVPGYQSGTNYALFAPSGTATTITARLNQEIARALNKQDVAEKLFKAGVEVVASSPEQLAATIRSEVVRMDAVIRGGGIRAE